MPAVGLPAVAAAREVASMSIRLIWSIHGWMWWRERRVMMLEEVVLIEAGNEHTGDSGDGEGEGRQTLPVMSRDPRMR